VSDDDAKAMHYLGILSAEEGDFEQAEYLLNQAIKQKPQDLSLHLHLANVYKARKKYDQAIQLLQAVIKINPKFAAAYNNLGTIYDANLQWDAAIKSYSTAIDIQPNYTDAYYNLGLALTKANRFAEAMNTYQALLELAKEHAGGQFQLGRLLMQQHQYQQAISYFSRIEQDYPAHFETQANLATCYLKLGWLNQANTHYLRALNVKPDDTQVLFNLGVIAMQSQRVTEAIAFYTRLLNHDADFYAAHNNIAVAYLSVKNRKKALEHFREALRIQPDKALEHTIDILMQDKELSSSPPEYVRALFNAYADHYDAHITQTLKYSVPEQLFKVVNDYTDVKQTNWTILDMGCGTGLCGELFKGEHNTLIGIDIAVEMLNLAAEKKIYQQLIETDIVEFLKEQHDVYDLIIAGDVLVYMGELHELFDTVYQTLHRDGLFAFNAEIDANKDYRMTESGRFAHSKAYLDGLILTNQFNIVTYKVIHLRTQNGVPVHGHLYLVGK